MKFVFNIFSLVKARCFALFLCRLVSIVLFCMVGSLSAMFLVPMDGVQTDHLKAYGVVYHALKEGVRSYWLLNYRGGSFAIGDSKKVELRARKYGVAIEHISKADFAKILTVIENNNMEKVTLEKAPDIAVYIPPSTPPWDDAVVIALKYADIPYDTIYDKEVLAGRLTDYDWLHLHHEDFTGQYSKFYHAFRHAQWYKRQKMQLEKLAKSLGFSKVPECKKAVALAIRQYVEKGGFLFAMCSATNTLDIALASLGTDIVEQPFDGDGVDPQYRDKLDFANCFAFENFTIETSAMASYFGNIDFNMVNYPPMRKPALDFQLFSFSAKLDRVPTMLTQNHISTVKGYFGLCTSYNKDVIKKSVTILGFIPGTKRVKYLHSVRGEGMFAFLSGHDPEDYAHHVGDRHTLLELHKNSPGYRLILNNVLFPAAEKKEKKT